MSDVSAGPVPSAIERLAPYVLPRRDRVLPMLIGLSLAVHATIFLPSLFHRSTREAPRQEIPVELVQLPPPAPPKPPPPQPRQAAQKPPPNSQPAPKPQPAQKPPEQKVAQKPPPPKPPAPKPQPKPQMQQQPSGEERMKQLLGPMPAIALPGASADGSDSVAYSQLVLSKVAKAKKQGRYNGIPGAASVAFTIGDAGEAVEVHIVRPSGDASLDEEAIAMVKRGAPYPPPPPGGRRDYAITLRFQAL